jgi:hypothetical protein
VIPNKSYAIPAFQHPNSPYVPWTPPTRRKILRPPPTSSESPMASSSFSRPSRSGAMAPEPDCSKEKLHGIGRWRNIRRVFKQNLDQIKKRVTRPFKFGKSPVAAPLEPSHSVSIESIFENIPSPAQYATPPQSPCLRSPYSIASTESNSLTEWLAERQREVMERDSDPAGLSLDEYEKMGSWINMAEVRKPCGFPECEVHLPNPAMMTLKGMATKILEEGHSSQIPTDTPLQIRSTPTLPSMISRCFDSVEFPTTSATRRDRHTSMPG